MIILETDCTNPINLPGKCMNIRSCTPLLDLLRTYGTSVTNFLRNSLCGFDGRDPKVCCPTSESNVDENGNEFSTTPSPEPPLRNTSYGPLLAPNCGQSNGPIPKIVGGVPAILGNQSFAFIFFILKPQFYFKIIIIWSALWTIKRSPTMSEVITETFTHVEKSIYVININFWRKKKKKKTIQQQAKNISC